LAPVALLALFAIPALAFDPAPGDTPILSDQWVLDFQYSISTFRSNLQAGSGTLVGAWIQLEDDIGVEGSKDLWKLGGIWRWGTRSSLAFGYTSYERSGAQRIEKEIEVEDVVYDVGAKIQATVDWQQLLALYRWSAVNSGKTEAGFSAGLSSIWVEGTLEGKGTLIEEPAPTKVDEIRTYKTGAKVFAPVPVLGAYIVHAFTPRLIFSTSGEVFFISAGDYTGSNVGANATLRYFVTRNFGLGASFYASAVRIEREGGDKPYRVELGQTGLGLVLTGAF